MTVTKKKSSGFRGRRINLGIRGRIKMSAGKKAPNPARGFPRFRGVVDLALAYMLVNGGVFIKKNFFAA